MSECLQRRSRYSNTWSVLEQIHKNDCTEPLLKYYTFPLLRIRHSGAIASVSESSEIGQEEAKVDTKDQIMHRAHARSPRWRRCGVGVVTEQM